MSQKERNADLADAVLGAEEILEVLHERGTRGVEQECNAARIAAVYHNVRAAKRHVIANPATSDT